MNMQQMVENLLEEKQVKLFLCFFLTERHAMEAYWGVVV
jgi:hypothetical protein